MPGESQPIPTEAPVQRRDERKTTNWIATIRLKDGAEIPCNVKDVSKSGARIGLPARQELPDTFILRIIGRDFLCLVRVAWRRGDYVGVRIERVAKAPVKQQSEPAPAASPPPPTAPSEPAFDPEAGGIGARSRQRAISAFWRAKSAST